MTRAEDGIAPTAIQDSGVPGERIDLLLLAFNRPDLLARTVAALDPRWIRRAFLSVDGPRDNNPDDAEAIQECVDTVIDGLGPAVEVHIRRPATNAGMRRACVDGIDWFFEHATEGAIIEDDCIPDASFLPFVAEMLARHRNDERVMGVCSGRSPRGPAAPDAHSYGYGRTFSPWGWATWRRAWRHNRPNLEGISPDEIMSVLASVPGSTRPFQRWWSRLLAKSRVGIVPSWSFPWTFSVWRAGGVFVIPRGRLIQNIGFDARATQTYLPDAEILPTIPVRFPLDHPTDIVVDVAYDTWYDREVRGIGWSLEAKTIIRRSLSRRTRR